MLRGKDNTGKDLIISQAYITRGMCERAAELSTGWLGPRTAPEIQCTLLREVDKERWTSLDGALQREARDGLNHVDQPVSDPKLPAKTELAQFPVGAVVEARSSTEVRAVDKNIGALAVDGLYHTDHHLTVAKAQATSKRDPHEVVDAHVRRLEA